jgi:hypothetical protein
VPRVDKMVKSGRLTEDEADRLRAAGDLGAFDSVVRDIRVRHARATLNAALSEGRLTTEEADGLLQRLKNGEHSRSLRDRVRAVRPKVRGGTPPTGSAPPHAGGHQGGSA